LRINGPTELVWELVMRISTWDLARQLIAAALLSAAAVAAMFAAASKAGAADMSGYYGAEPSRGGPVIAACGPQETVVLFNKSGVPTAPARTPYFYCLTGTTLLPGDIPPPPEYCCH
jgi:hypothetical protein